MIGDFNDIDYFCESDSNSSSSSSSVTSHNFTYSSDEELPYSHITASDTDIDTTTITESDTEMDSTNNIHLEDTLHASENLSVFANDSVPVLDVSNNCLTSPSHYKLVGDNIDSTVNPRYMRLDNKVKSLHYYHTYAVQDRINVHDFINDRQPLTSVSVQEKARSLLPTESDDDAIIKNIKILFARILFDTLKFFQMTFEDLIVEHIKHRRYQEMSSKSVVVSYLYFRNNVILLHDFLHRLSPKEAERLIFNRFINTSGHPGRNISCDLHIEHLNRELKNCINPGSVKKKML